MSLTDKASYKRRLATLKRRMEKVVDWSCNTAELKRDDLILDLHALAKEAVESLPNEGDVIIRWQLEDVQDTAIDVGLRLSRKVAGDILCNLRSALEETVSDAGWDMIAERLLEVKGARSRKKRQVV